MCTNVNSSPSQHSLNQPVPCGVRKILYISGLLVDFPDVTDISPVSVTTPEKVSVGWRGQIVSITIDAPIEVWGE